MVAARHLGADHLGIVAIGQAELLGELAVDRDRLDVIGVRGDARLVVQPPQHVSVDLLALDPGLVERGDRLLRLEQRGEARSRIGPEE